MKMKLPALIAALIALIAAGAVAFILLSKPDEKPGRALSPTVDVGEIKERGTDKTIQDAVSDEDEDRLNVPGSIKGKAAGKANLTAAQEREYSQALSFAPTGEKLSVADQQLKRFGASKVGTNKTGGRLFSIYRLPSGKQFIMVISLKGEVVTATAATPTPRGASK